MDAVKDRFKGRKYSPVRKSYQAMPETEGEWDDDVARVVDRYPADSMDDFYRRYGDKPVDSDWSDAEDTYARRSENIDTYDDAVQDENGKWSSKKFDAEWQALQEKGRRYGERRRRRASGEGGRTSPMITGDAFGGRLSKEHGER